MGDHSTPRGERSSYGNFNHAGGSDKYKGKHRREDVTHDETVEIAGSDLPPRGRNIRYEN